MILVVLRTEHTIGQALSIFDDASVGVIKHVRFVKAFCPLIPSFIIHV